MGQLKTLVGDAVWYGLSSIIGRVISYVLTPLYTSIFLTEEYGIVTELYAYVAFINVLYMYGMETAFFRFATKYKEKSNEYFNLCVSSLISTSFIASGLLMLFATPIMSVLGYEGNEQIIYWLAAVMAIDSIYALPFAKLRLAGEAKKFAFIRLSNVIIAVLLNLFFLVLCDGIVQGKYLQNFEPVASFIYSSDFKIKYVFLSNLMANSIFIIFLSSQFKGFKYHLDFSKFKPVFLYGLPLVLMGIAGTVNEMLSRALLKYWLPENFYSDTTNLSALGIFGACYKLSVFMLLGTQAFRYAAEPFFFSKADDAKSPQLFSDVMKGFVIFNCIVFLGVVANLEPLGILFLSNPVYREGLHIVPFLLMGYLFMGIYYNLSVWFKVTDKTMYGALITGLGACVTIVANILLIPVLGYLGSAVTTLATYFFMAALSYFMGQKHYPVPYRVKNALYYILMASTLAYVSYYLDMGNLLLNMLLKNTAIPLFIVAIYLSERKYLKGKVYFGVTLP